jgi:hypothetical protein
VLITAEIYTLMKNAPDQLTDDTEYSKKFSAHGDKTEMATLTRVSNTNMGRQLDPLDEQHPSDYHRGRRVAYGAGFIPDRAKGEWIKAGFDEAYSAGVRDRTGAVEPGSADDDELDTAWFKFRLARSAFRRGDCGTDFYDAARNGLVETLRRVQTGARVMTPGERERVAKFGG